MIDSVGIINPVNYPAYPPKLKIPYYKSLDCVCPEPNCGIHEENPFCDVPLYPISGSKPYNHLGCFKRAIRSYWGLDGNADNYVKKVRELIDKPMDEIELEEVRIAMAKVKCPKNLDISVFYKLTGRLPHEDLGYDEGLLIHLYNTFYNESIKFLGKMVKCRTNVVYHLLDKIGKEPNVDHFQFMKGPAHQ